MARVPGGASEPAHGGGDARGVRKWTRRAGDGGHERTRQAAAAREARGARGPGGRRRPRASDGGRRRARADAARGRAREQRQQAIEQLPVIFLFFYSICRGG